MRPPEQECSGHAESEPDLKLLLLLLLLNRYFLMASHHERAMNRPADRPAIKLSKLDK